MDDTGYLAQSPEDLPFVESMIHGKCWAFQPTGHPSLDFLIGEYFCQLAIDYLSRTNDLIFFRRLLDDISNSRIVSCLEEGFLTELCHNLSKVSSLK